MMVATICSDCGAALAPSKRRKGTRCKPCHARHMARSPEKLEKCRVAMQRRFADPNLLAEHKERIGAGIRRAMNEDPEFRAKRIEAGHRVGKANLGNERRPAGSPSRVAAGRARSDTVLSWCPVEYRDEYRHFVRTKLVRAREARRLIEQLIAADLKAYRETGTLPQAARAERAAGYGAGQAIASGGQAS